LLVLTAVLMTAGIAYTGERSAVPVTNNMRLYLCREAERITHGSLQAYSDLKAWEADRPKRYRQFLEMMGLQNLPPREKRPPVKVHHVGTLERDGYKIEKIYYESLPHLYVPADLYIPTNVKGPVPGVLYVCGHSRTQKVHYQPYPRRFAQLGFVALIPETIQWGEILGEHWGCWARGWFHWYSRGYTPGGVELLNGIRGLDLLQERPEVNPERLGVTGISGGGALSWYVAAADDRIKVAAPVCGTGTLESHIEDRTIDGHCDCMWQINTYLWDNSDIAALIAPRPLMIASANRDGLFSIDAIRECHRATKRIYDLYNASENLVLVETPGPHSYHETSRTKIFSWFLKHLCDRDVPPEKVGDIDSSEKAQESAETLRIYVDGPPADDRTTTIQDSFIEIPEPPKIASVDDLEEHRQKVVAFLKEKTFGAFPPAPCNLDISLDFQFLEGEREGGHHYRFTPEEGWRLKLDWRWNSSPDTPAPAVLMLRSPQATSRRAAEEFLRGAPETWSHSFLETRGVGETSWGPEIQWHLRRAAAWTGRTVASMRVYDTLRCLEVLRRLPGVDGERVVLAADGEMAAVALYAALLDGRLKAVIVGNPPATQNAASEPDGTGQAIEMLNSLRVTDLPQVAGLLWPARLVLVGSVPDSYRWTKELYARLGSPGVLEEVPELRQWKPFEL
jgi:dienelactone hydrolase